MEKRFNAANVCISMLKVVQIITAKKDEIPNFSEYLKIVKIIEENKDSNPDICIETCKSLVEGMSKQILLFLDASQSTNTVGKLNFPDLFKKTLEKILEFDSAFEIDFTESAFFIIARLGQIRNKRGEISHGKSYPKDEQSSALLSDLVVSTTDALLTYILISFYSIDLTKHLPIPYDLNPKYNSYLDEAHQSLMDLGILYSKALYDQDYIQYKQLLLEYNSSQEEIINDSV